MKRPSPPANPQPDWADVVDFIKPFVFRVVGDSAAGTAFLVARSLPKEPSDACSLMFATARHVIMPDEVLSSRLALSSPDGSTTFASTDVPCQAYGLGPREFDTGLIIVDVPEVPEHLMVMPPILPHSQKVRQGADIGWLGYPGLAGSNLSFFSGVLSSHLDEPIGYLVDGVAINGVSGGPAFIREGSLVGIVSSYRPNWLSRTTALPGLVTLISLGYIDYWMDKSLTQRKLDWPDA